MRLKLIPFFAGLLLTVLASAPFANAAGFCGDPATRPWCDSSLSPSDRTTLLLEAMTPEQRISMLGGDDVAALVSPDYTGIAEGIPDLGIPDLLMADGPVGVRVGKATAMPSTMALAATFNRSLAWKYGAVLAAETKSKGNDMLFGPTIDIMRTPLAGRSFETFGEDPLLTSELTVPYIEGVQDNGVIATAKHYVGNNQEGWGGADADKALPGTSPAGLVHAGARTMVDARIGERAMQEIYLPAFVAAVREAKVGAVMCAYNKVNTNYACENEGLLDGRLRKQMGFSGMVVADYFAVYDTAKAVKAGLTMEPWPGQVLGPDRLNQALEQGTLTQADIDERAGEYLNTLFQYGMFDRDPYVRNEDTIDWEGHDQVARQVGAQSLTLMKNDGLLPLDQSAGQSVALIGPGVNRMIKGGGSSEINAHSFTSPVTSFTERLGADKVTVADGKSLSAAVDAAKQSDVAIVIAGNYMTEFVDRRCLSLECPPAYGDQDALISAVAEANPRTVVVLETGAPVLTPWRDQVSALVSAWYPGQSPGPVLADLIYGVTDPGGRLPVTFPADEAQIPLSANSSLYPGVDDILSYADGVNVGYRSYRMRGQTPAFAFGSGLSYTKFRAGKLKVLPPRKGAFARVQTRVTNIGERDGFAVPQLYLKTGPVREGTPTPIRLAGFRKLELNPGESAKVTFALTRRNLSFYNVTKKKWVLNGSCPRVFLGWSSAELRSQATLPLSKNCGKVAD